MTIGNRRLLAALCVVIYASMVTIGAVYHEPWADEAQSWLLARDNSWFETQWQYLRYEGTPGLWHTLLFVPTRLGLPYETSIATISAVSAIAGVVLFLRYSPLPLWLGAMVPFSFFVLYQYAIVARSYCLLLILLPLATHFEKTCRWRPIRLIVVLVLMAHVSLHGALLSLAFMAQVGWDMMRERRDWRSWAIARGTVAVVLYALNGLVLVALLWPPTDQIFAAKSYAGVEATATGLFYAAYGLAGYLAPTPLVQIVLVLALLTMVWAALRGVIFGLLAAILLSVLAGVKYANAWHEGMVFLAWIFTMWLAWERFLPQHRLRLHLTSMITAAILSLHIYYGLFSWRMDLQYSYSGARDAARYLAERRGAGQTLWAYDFSTVAIQPYFDRPLFANYAAANEGKAFFLWSKRSADVLMPISDHARGQLCARKPDLVLTVRETRYPAKLEFGAFAACGYEIEREFPGTQFFQDRHLNDMTYLVLRRRAGS